MHFLYTLLSDGDNARLNLKRAEDLQVLRQENNEMTRLLLKMRSMSSWKVTQLKEHYNKLVSCCMIRG